MELHKRSVLSISDLDALVLPNVSSLKPMGGIAKEIYEKAGPLYWEHCRKQKLLSTGKVDVYLDRNDLGLALLSVVPPTNTKSPKDPIRLSDSFFHLFEECRRHEILSLGMPNLERMPHEYPLSFLVPTAFVTLSEWCLLYPDYPLNIVFGIEDKDTYAFYRSFVRKYIG